MMWQLPWVSRRAYELQGEQLERALKERDSQQDRADRLADQLVNRFGFEPVSAPVRAEMKEAAKELEAYEASFEFDDVGAGMIAQEFLVDADPAKSN